MEDPPVPPGSVRLPPSGEERINYFLNIVRTGAKRKKDLDVVGADLETFDFLQWVLQRELQTLAESEPCAEPQTKLVFQYFCRYDQETGPLEIDHCRPLAQDDILERWFTHKYPITRDYEKASKVLEWRKVVRCCEYLGEKYGAKRVEVTENGWRHTITFHW